MSLKKSFVLFFLFIISAFIFFFSLSLARQKSKKNQTLSSLPPPSKNILFYTSPINNLSLKVEKIEGEEILGSKEFYYNPAGPEMFMPLSTPENITPPPTPYKQILTFKIKTTPKTIIEQENAFIPLFFQKPKTQKLTLADIKKQDNINVFFKEDLRTVTDNKLTALRIVLPPITNQITGKITKIEKDKIQIETTQMMPPSMMAPTPKPQTTFTFLVDNETEVSYQKKVKEPMPGTSTPVETFKPVQESIADLKVGDQVRIYSFSDILKTQNPKAVRIEPIKEQ
jgi:preprotein translocase subunit YajC